MTKAPQLIDRRDDMDAASDGRSRILRTAAHLFLTRGYAETSLRTIADQVGMRPASIYHHFDSKDALLTDILSIGMNAVVDAFAEVEASADRAEVDKVGPERLRRHVSAHLQALFANQAFTAAHVTVFPFAPPDVRSAAVPERDAYEARWTALIESIAPGLEADQIRVVRLALFGAMNSTLQWFDPTEGALDELAGYIVDALWYGIQTTEAAR